MLPQPVRKPSQAESRPRVPAPAKEDRCSKRVPQVRESAFPSRPTRRAIRAPASVRPVPCSSLTIYQDPAPPPQPVRSLPSSMQLRAPRSPRYSRLKNIQGHSDPAVQHRPATRFRTSAPPPQSAARYQRTVATAIAASTLPRRYCRAGWQPAADCQIGLLESVRNFHCRFSIGRRLPTVTNLPHLIRTNCGESVLCCMEVGIMTNEGRLT